MPICIQCETKKPRGEFYDRPQTKRGHGQTCKPCRRKLNNARGKERYYDKHEEILAQKRAAHKRQNELLRAEMLDAYGNECECCSESIEIFLDLDHINGRTDSDKRLYRGHASGPGTKLTGVLMYRKAKAEGWPDKYRILCSNCNRGYHRLGICPHQTLKDSTPKNSTSN